MGGNRSKQLLTRAERLMPAGVNSPVRAFRAVNGEPFYVAKGEGAFLFDVDGRSYIDYVCSWGPLILGHAHPQVVAAISQAAQRGTSYGTPHPAEVELAEVITSAMPWIEMLRCVNSGTEAVMSAVRLARAATGRDVILKFEGQYHGHVDYLLAKAGSGLATFGLPDSAGVPQEMTRNTRILPFNDIESVRSLFKQEGKTLAAVLVEPVAGNMGVIPPEDGFLAGLRELTQHHGALLIFDEIITGFRVSAGGAAERYDIRPDLVCLGKIIGGGMPVGAYGGRRELMELVAPLGPVYQAGTLSGNPVALAAGLATLEQLGPELYATLEERGSQLEQGLASCIRSSSVTASIHRVGSMMSVFFTPMTVKDSGTAMSTDRSLYAKLFHALLKRGVYLPPSALETWFVSSAHSPDLLDRTVEAFSEALTEASGD